MQLVLRKCLIHRLVLHVRVFVVRLLCTLAMTTAAFLLNVFFYRRYRGVFSFFTQYVIVILERL